MYRGEEIAMHSLRREALSRRDAPRYTELCDTLGIHDIEDLFLYERGMLELTTSASTESQYGRLHMSEIPQEQGTFNPKAFVFDYRAFLKFSDRHELSPGNIFRDTDLKREALAKGGYKRAFSGSEEKKVALIDAKPERIGKMFQNVYEDACKKAKSERIK